MVKRIFANSGTWLGIIFLIFAGTLFVQALDYNYYSKVGPGPGLLPRWLSGLMIILSVLYIIDCNRQAPISVKDLLPQGEGQKKVLIFMGALIIFIVSISYLGFILSSVVMLLLLFKIGYNWYSSLLFSIMTTLIVYGLFRKILSVPLPVGILGF